MKRPDLHNFLNLQEKVFALKWLIANQAIRQRWAYTKNWYSVPYMGANSYALFQKRKHLHMGVEKPRQPDNFCHDSSYCTIEMTLNISHTLIWGVHWKLLPQSSYIFWTEFVDQSLVQAGSTQIQASPVGMEPQTRRCFLCPFDPKRKDIRTCV